MAQLTRIFLGTGKPNKNGCNDRRKSLRRKRDGCSIRLVCRLVRPGGVVAFVDADAETLWVSEAERRLDELPTRAVLRRGVVAPIVADIT